MSGVSAAPFAMGLRVWKREEGKNVEELKWSQCDAQTLERPIGAQIMNANRENHIQIALFHSDSSAKSNKSVLHICGMYVRDFAFGVCFRHSRKK